MTTTKAAIASDALTTALLDAAGRQLRPHCSDPETDSYWLSEGAPERSMAVALCRAPAIDCSRRLGRR